MLYLPGNGKGEPGRGGDDVTGTTRVLNRVSGSVAVLQWVCISMHLSDGKIGEELRWKCLMVAISLYNKILFLLV